MNITTSYGRTDWYYTGRPALDPKVVEAMDLFVAWAVENDRNYVSDLVLENLAASIEAGLSPQEAVDDLVARAS